MPNKACQKYLSPVLTFDWSIPDPWGVPSRLSLANLQSTGDKKYHYNHMHCFVFNFDNKHRQEKRPTLAHFWLVESAPNEMQFHISLLIKEFSNVVLSFENNFDTSVKCCTGLCRQITCMLPAARNSTLSVVSLYKYLACFVPEGFQCFLQLFGLAGRNSRKSYIHCKFQFDTNQNYHNLLLNLCSFRLWHLHFICGQKMNCIWLAVSMLGKPCKSQLRIVQTLFRL
jgi:hypothetical protein